MLSRSVSFARWWCSMTSPVRRLLVALALSTTALAVGAGSAIGQVNESLDPTQFAISEFTTSTSDMTAGSRPDAGTVFGFNSDEVQLPNEGPFVTLPYGRSKRIEVDLPP